MAQVYAAKYLAKAALSAPRDMVRAAVAKYTPLHPTVLIFHCTFVCDARCEMCSNWTRGNRKTDMSLAQIEQAFSSKLWKNIENAVALGRRADHAQRHGRHLPGDDRQVPEAAQADHQHDRPDAAPRHPDADQGRRDVPRARTSSSPPACRSTASTTCTARSATSSGVREGGQDDRRDAGAAEEVPLQLRHLLDHLLDEPRRRRQHPGVGEEGEAGHRLQHGPLHRRHARQQRPAGRAASRWASKSSACASSSSTASARIRCSTARTTSTCTTRT